MLSSGLLSVIGSIVDQRVRLPADDIRVLLAGSTSPLLAAELPKPEDVVAAPAAWRVFASNAGVYEALLHAAMVLFNERGYAETSMAQIASAAGIRSPGSTGTSPASTRSSPLGCAARRMRTESRAT